MAHCKQLLRLGRLARGKRFVDQLLNHLNAITVDEQTNPYTLLMMALAFRDATGASGITGSVYWSNPDYYVDGVGSSVLLDDQRNLELFTALADGTHEPGVVGTLAESQ